MWSSNKPLLFVAVFLVGITLLGCRPPASKEALSQRRLAMERLGEYVSKIKPNSKILLLSNPFTKMKNASGEIKAFDQASLAGLENGLGKDHRIVVAYPKLSQSYLDHPETFTIPSNSKTPLSFILDTGSLDSLLAEHQDCQIIVSVIGLPVGITLTKAWKMNEVSFALLSPDLKVLGNRQTALEAFKKDKILAAVVQREGKDASNSILITSDNIESILKDQPALLGYKERCLKNNFNNCAEA